MKIIDISNCSDEVVAYINDLQTQLQQKENIIKEVREYIENTTYADITRLETHSIKEFWFVKELLEILDKVGDEISK